MRNRPLLALVALLSYAAQPGGDAGSHLGPVAACGTLVELKLPNTTITSAQSVTDGTFTPPGAPNPITGLPPYCRVGGTIAPTADSQIRFEVWMPLEQWNGKLAGVGNGGWGGV